MINMFIHSSSVRYALFLAMIGWQFTGHCESEAAKKSVVDHLVKQLGADKSRVRKEAREALLTKGHLAWKALKTLDTGDDPEVTMAVKALLEKLKYTVVPGVESDVRDLYRELDDGENGGEIWKIIAKKQPEAIVELLLEVSRDDKFSHSLKYGVHSYLTYCRPIHAAAYVKTLAKKDQVQLVQILDRVNGEFYSLKEKQMLFFYCYGDYSRAVARAFELWDSNRELRAIDIAAVAISRSNTLSKFWGMGGAKDLSGKRGNPSLQAYELLLWYCATAWKRSSCAWFYGAGWGFRCRSCRGPFGAGCAAEEW